MKNVVITIGFLFVLGVDFVSPTIDKTVVATPNGTYTIPGPAGSGTNYINPLVEQRPCRNVDRVPHCIEDQGERKWKR